MIDKECLSSMEKEERFNFREPHCVVLGLEHLLPPPPTPTEEDLEELEEEGGELGFPDDDEAWILAACKGYSSLYGELCGMGSWWRWRMAPPEVYPFK